jgi:hypothetical protein
MTSFIARRQSQNNKTWVQTIATEAEGMRMNFAGHVVAENLIYASNF